MLPLVDNDRQVNQLWFEVHAPPPFLWEIGAAVARVFLGPTEREAVATLTWAYSGSRNRTTVARRVRPSGLPARRASPSRCGDRTAKTGIAWPLGLPLHDLAQQEIAQHPDEGPRGFGVAHPRPVLSTCRCAALLGDPGATHHPRMNFGDLCVLHFSFRCFLTPELAEVAIRRYRNERG